VSTRPCPNCGASIPAQARPAQARFCGQCGTTIASAAPSAASAYTPDVHEEVTVARDMPDLSAIKTLMDSASFGSDSDRPPFGTPAAPILTPVVSAPETQSRPEQRFAKTQMLGQTISDPDAQSRAREMIDAALGQAATAQAPAVPPKRNLHQTMLMGGENASAPPPVVHGAPGARSPSDRPTSPPEAPNVARGNDASPLSRSVLAPSSFGSGAAQPAPAAPAAQPAPQAAADPLASSVGVNRVVSIGSPAEAAAPPAAAAPAPAPAAAPAPARPAGPAPAAGAPALRTMLGMSASELGLPSGSGAPFGGTMPLGGPPASAAAPVPAPHNVQKTMLGVAIPGIAPTHGASTDPHAGPTSQAGGPVDLRSKQSTMLGVAIPGIAPTHDRAPAGHGATVQMAQSQPRSHSRSEGVHVPSQVQNTALGIMAPPEVQIVPRPKTLIDEPLPIAPQLPQKRGIPAVAVVGILFAIVAVAGGGIAFFALRNGGTLTAVPQLDENGRESLKIGCPTCPDGTTVALGASSATVTGGNALLPLPAPLSIGENDLGVKIERPAGGRHEEVKVHVPVAYRVRADLSTLSAKPPAITVRIEATPGSTVSVEDKPVTLDATGRGSYAIDLAKETEGTGDAKTFERKIPFAITPKGGKAESGQLTARTAIVPLALDAPGKELLTDKASAAVAGQTRAGTTVTIDGQKVPVDAQGKFGVRVELSAVGEKPLEIVASAPPLAPRIAKVKVTRVASLADAAKGEDAQNPVGYDVFGTEPASKIGQKAVVEGEVVEARATAGHTVLLVEDKRKCAKGASCLVRIVHGDDDKVARGDSVRAYGRVLGAITASGKTVPDIEATLVMPVKAAK
jgi:hypothetical protein